MDYYSQPVDHPYPANYLSDAMNILGQMFDYRFYDLKLEMQEIFDMFLDSGVAEDFGAGHPKYVSGMVGIGIYLLAILENTA